MTPNPAAPPSTGRRSLGSILRPLAAATCLLAVVVAVGPGAILRAIGGLGPAELAVALLLHAAIVVALSERWRMALRPLAASLPAAAALRMTASATLMNLVLPASVGGDVVRVVLGHRHGISASQGITAGIFDRLIGLATLIFVVLGGALLSPHLIPADWLGPLALLAALICIGTAAAAWMLRRSGRLTRWRAAATGQGIAKLLSPAILLKTAALSALGTAISAIIASVLAHGIGSDLPLSLSLALFPAVLLVSALPLSIGGWGLREVAAVPALSLSGMPADQAVAVSLCFGLTQMAAAALIAAALWLLDRPGRKT